MRSNALLSSRFIVVCYLPLLFVFLTACSESSDAPISEKQIEEPVPAIVTVTGKVVDSRGNPIPLANISISDHPAVLQTDIKGNFSASVKEGGHRLTVYSAQQIIIDQDFRTSGANDSDLGIIPAEIAFYPWYQDSDSDGFGSTDSIVNATDQPAGYVLNYYDCDDTRPLVNPAAAEVCNVLDDNCNGVVDEGGNIPFYADNDGDSFGNIGSVILSCFAPTGYVANSTDCNDSDALINPGADEICNGVDDTCNGQVDEGVMLAFYIDNDNDTYGDPYSVAMSCNAPTGYVANNLDCNDFDATINPGADEVCNGADDTCDGQIDEGVTTVFYQDADTDGYGDLATSTAACTVPEGYVTDASDCDDTNPDLNPTTSWHVDSDSDTYFAETVSVLQCLSPGADYAAGFTLPVFDCNDNDVGINPGQTEIFGNTLDDDCNPSTPDIAGFLPGELAGQYRTTSITIGDRAAGDWVGWEKGDITVDANGTISNYETVLSDGTSNDVPPIEYRAELLPSGILTFLTPLQAAGAMSSDGQDITVVSPEEGTSIHLSILQRISDGLTLSDLEGEWSFRALSVNDASGGGYAYRGTHTIDAVGRVATTTGDVAANTPRVHDAYVLDTFGKALKGLNPADIFTLSQDGNLLVGSYTDVSDYRLEIALKVGSNYSTSDLAGDWSFNVLTTSTNTNDNAMGHGVLRINNAGVGDVLFQTWSSPVTSILDGNLQVTSNGVITHSEMPNFHGQLSGDLNTLVAIHGDASGPMGLLVGQRRRGPPTVIDPDLTRRSFATFGFSGGILETAAADGTIYTLDVPSGALGQDTQISIAPATSIQGALTPGTLYGLAQFEPDGLILDVPATLRIQSNLSGFPQDLTGFNFNGVGADRFAYQPASQPGLDTIELDILHFSGAGVTWVDPATLPDPDAYYDYMIQHIFETATVGNAALDQDAASNICGLFEKWISSLTARALVAGSLDELNAIISNILVMAQSVQALGMDGGDICSSDCGYDISPLVSVINDTVTALLTEYDNLCKPLPDPCVRRELTLAVEDLVANSQKFNGMCEFDTYDANTYLNFCSSFARNNGVYIFIEPSESGVVVGDAISLTARSLAPDIEWSIVGLTDSIASITATGEVIGLSVGTASVSAHSATACATDVAVVHVHPPVEGNWRVEVVERTDIRQYAGCDVLPLPDPYRVDISTGGAGSTHPGATAISWSGGAEINRVENLSGNQLSHLIELAGLAVWPEAGAEPVSMHCELNGNIDFMTGGCSFHWLGDYIDGVGFTGCWGTDEVEVTRITPSFP